ILICRSGIRDTSWDNRWDYDANTPLAVPYFTTLVVKFRNGVSGVIYRHIGFDWRRLRFENNPAAYIYPEKMKVATHYGFNGRHHCHYLGKTYPFVSRYNGTDAPRKGQRLAGIRVPSDTWLSGDGAWADLGLSEMVFRHIGRANVSYLDGHSRSFQPSEVDGETIYGRMCVVDSRLWAVK
ncbi:MAG: hypothetical protein N3A66_10975, partial [Planctomycetota bacterium]|nr:hypothetical protein [Planctomycetota bacterium]